MKSNRLGRCPFCGSEADIIKRVSVGAAPAYTVRCMSGDASLGKYCESPEEAIREWNESIVKSSKGRRVPKLEYIEREKLLFWIMQIAKEYKGTEKEAVYHVYRFVNSMSADCVADFYNYSGGLYEEKPT